MISRPSRSGKIAVYPSLSLLNQDLYCACYSKFVDAGHYWVSLNPEKRRLQM